MNTAHHADAGSLRTWFASAERSPAPVLAEEISIITESAVVDGILKTVQGLVAVLNENRQILALNDLFFRDLQIENGPGLLGLRLGEALSCVHSHDSPGGCGTGRFCSTCGAAIAVVSALASESPEERKCIMTYTRDNIEDEVVFSVKATTIVVQERKFVLVFLRDLTEEEKRAALERVFFHDLNNLVMALSGLAEVVAWRAGSGLENVVGKMRFLSRRLVREVQIQKALTQGEGYQLQREVVSLQDVLADLKEIVDELPQARGKRVDYKNFSESVSLVTDLPLLVRVLTNMALNALEASPDGGEVVVSAGKTEDSTFFTVWNAGQIPDAVALRIFQRFFSTKEGRGRGLGTYSMKFFGEFYLGGKVAFTTSRDEGTTFSLRLPVAGPAHATAPDHA